jgi:hypothetical protein
MQNSLPARPSLEQLKKLAKDLVKNHQEKQPAALALIRRHDAQSVIARQYGFASWNELRDHVEALQKTGADGLTPPLDVDAKMRTVSLSYQQKDYALFCSVMSEEMKAKLPKERFEDSSDRLSAYFKADYHLTYMGSVKRSGRHVYFWRLWVEDWDSDRLVRMTLNDLGLASALLYSQAFDSAFGTRK